MQHSQVKTLGMDDLKTFFQLKKKKSFLRGKEFGLNRAPPWQARGSEFKPQNRQERKKKVTAFYMNSKLLYIFKHIFIFKDSFIKTHSVVVQKE
jgi:hypothetical protein